MATGRRPRARGHLHQVLEPDAESWATTGVDDLPIIVTIARKGSETVATQIITCAMQNPTVSAAAVANALGELLPLSSPDPPVTEADKRITVWHLHFGNSDVGIGMVTDATKTGAILSAVNVQNTPVTP